MRKMAWPLLSLASLAACLGAPILHFLGKLSSSHSKLVFLAASVGWFIFATLWTSRR